MCTCPKCQSKDESKEVNQEWGRLEPSYGIRLRTYVDTIKAVFTPAAALRLAHGYTLAACETDRYEAHEETIRHIWTCTRHTLDGRGAGALASPSPTAALYDPPGPAPPTRRSNPHRTQEATHTSIISGRWFARNYKSHDFTPRLHTSTSHLDFTPQPPGPPSWRRSFVKLTTPR